MIMVAKKFSNAQTLDAEGTATEAAPPIAAVQERFARSPYLPLRKIRCYLHHGVLLLRGRVPTYYLKQLAQTIGHSLAGVRQVVNELEVDFPDRF